MRPTLSLCLVVKDEARLIAQALDGAREIADECVVVDTGSTDGTPDIARRLGARVLHYAWDRSLGRARNLYLSEATGTWVLVLDGDERIARADLPKIRPLLENQDAVAYRFTVHNYTRSLDLLGDWHPNAGLYPEEETFSQCPGHSRFPVVRLFRRGPGVRYEEGFSTHTNPLASLAELPGVVDDARVVLHHFHFLKGGEAFIQAKQTERLQRELLHLEMFPGHFLAHLNVGRTLFTLGRDREALVHLDRAITIDGSSAQAYLVRGMVRLQRRQFARAIRDLEASVARKPDFADAWTVLGMAYHGQRRTGAAERALRTALDHRPRHPVTLNSLGVLYLDRGRLREAETQFRRALDVLPGHPVAALNLADVLEAQGDREAAERACREALEHRPDDAELRVRLATLRGSRGADGDEAAVP